MEMCIIHSISLERTSTECRSPQRTEARVWPWPKKDATRFRPCSVELSSHHDCGIILDGWQPLPSYVSIESPSEILTRNIVTVGDDKPQRKGPLAIAHRGFSASYPENTMSAFVAAVEAGVQALETDVHLSNDEVVVLSHVRLTLHFIEPSKSW